MVLSQVKVKAKIYKALETEEGGIDRAMNKIKALMYRSKWWMCILVCRCSTTRTISSGEVVMATGWNGRFFNAEIGEGAPIKQVWDGQGLDYEYFVQVKGGPNDAKVMLKKL